MVARKIRDAAKPAYLARSVRVREHQWNIDALLEQCTQTAKSNLAVGENDRSKHEAARAAWPSVVRVLRRRCNGDGHEPAHRCDRRIRRSVRYQTGRGR